MSDSDFRVAVIGGRGHQSLTPGIGRGAKLVAIAADGCDDEAKKYQAAPWAAGAPYFEDWRQMLRKVKPEVISLGAQPARNGPIIIEALKRGIHVVSDKPIANTPAELRRLRALTAANPKLHLLTEFTMRSGPAFLAARDAVRAGKIGDVVLVTGQKSYRFGASRPDFYKSREGYPGTIAFVGCHIIDLAYWITGIKYVAALGGAQGNIAKKDYGEFEDHAIVLLKMANGADAVMHMDYLRPAAAPTHGDDRVRIAGSKGVIEVRDEKCVLITQEQAPIEIGVGGHDREAYAELLATLRGAGRGIYSTADSLYMAEVLLKARKSVDDNKAQKID